MPSPPADIARLDIVARELDLLAARLSDLAATARGLSAATDWRARAALAFHEQAHAWAGEVSALGCLAETARAAARRAHDRALHDWSVVDAAGLDAPGPRL